MSNNISTLVSVAAPLAIIVGLWVMAQISRRFGEVTHRPPLYRMFYAAMGLMALPVLVRLLAIGLGEAKLHELGGNSTDALLHDLPLAASITLAVVVAWRYWGWLIYADENHANQPPSQPKH